MEKISNAQFTELLGTDSHTFTVSAEGVVVGGLGTEGQTIVRFDALDPADADAARATLALYVGRHVAKQSDAASAEKAKQSAEYIRDAIADGRLSDGERDAAKAMLSKLLGVPAAAIDAEAARAIAATAEAVTAEGAIT